MTIRPATLADVDLLADLNAHVQELHVTAEGHIYRPTDRDELRSWFAEELARDETIALIAEDDGRPAGLLMAKVVRKPGHVFARPQSFVLVDQLAVDPGARRRGIGRRLMDSVEQHARGLGLPRVELDVRAFNRDAIAFYEDVGYAPVNLRMAREL